MPHQQIKTVLASGGRSVEHGPAATRPGLLAGILKEFADRGLNIRWIGGDGIETGGDLYLGFEHSEPDDDAHDTIFGATQQAVEILKAHGLPVEVRDLDEGTLDGDHAGVLAAFAAKIASQGLLVDRIHVATPDVDGTFPVLVATVSVGAPDQR